MINSTVYWITGASSGIGAALAVQLAQQNHALVLSGRNQKALEETRIRCLSETKNVVILPFDILDLDKFTEITLKAIDAFGKIDVLVNNAGASQRAKAMDTLPDVERHIMELNYFAPVALTKALMPHFVSRKAGHVVVISSIAAKFGFPLRSSYAAAKHALHGYFEALRLEHQDISFFVTMICPGRVKTPISLSALSGNGKPHGQMDEGQRKGISAEKCARRIVKAINQKSYEVVIGGLELIPVYLKRFAPFLFYMLIKRIKAT